MNGSQSTKRETEVEMSKHSIKRVPRGLLSLALMMLWASSGWAGLKMEALFSDNMVLQRGKEVPVFGMADPGADVKVECNGQSVTGQADSAGNWRVRLKAMEAAAGPLELKVSSKTSSLVFRNIAVGDVWVCSGQSNMEMPLGSCLNATADIAGANASHIRLFKGYTPWTVCSPDTVKTFSAVGYYFGRALNTTLKVPIGLISASVGATAIELWTPVKALDAVPELNVLVKNYNQALQDLPERKKKIEAEMAAWEQDRRPSQQTDPGDQGFEKGYARPTFDDSAWKTMDIPKPLESEIETDGAVWFRKDLEISEKWQGRQLHLELGPVDDFDVTYFNGEKVGAIGLETPSFHRVLRKYAIPARLVQKGRAVIAVRAFDHFGSGGFTGSPMMMKLYEDDEDEALSLAGAWHYKVEVPLDPKALKWPIKPFVSLGVPNLAVMYNGKIKPLIPFAIKGVIWYQGESNSENAGQYAKLLETMINGWRADWGEAFPFLIVQLAGHGNPCEFQDNASWAVLREAQFSVAESVPDCGIATAIDIGEAYDIHPQNKRDVGHRLALVALKKFYGQNAVSSGPVYDSMSVEKNRIRLKFSHIGSGLMAKGARLRGFVVAGVDGRFLRAQSVIEGDTVVVWSDRIENPKQVCYAWAMNPETANLYNKEGLPAFPFRTR
jgi:sialate O-acetylesterase